MKYLIKNVSRDPKYAIRRRAHPLHVTRAPFICGKRLYPRGHMPVESSILTAKDREHIDNLIKAGIIEVSIAGGASCIQRVTLAPKTVKPLVEKKVDTVEKPKEKPNEDVEGQVPESEPEKDSGADKVQTIGPTEEELQKMTKKDLTVLIKAKDSVVRTSKMKKDDMIAWLLEN